MQIQGNQAFLLSDPAKLWLVQSGSIALFAVRVKDGVVISARRYLFSSEPGELVCGMGIGGEQSDRAILAVGIPGDSATNGTTEIVEIEREQWQDLQSANHAYTVTLIATWCRKIQGVFAGISDLELSNISDAIIPDWELLMGELSQLHRIFWQGIDLIVAQEKAVGLVNLQAREKFNQQQLTQALSELESLLPDQQKFVETETDAQGSNQNEYLPLYLAAVAVGKALGIKIYLPINLNQDPLNAIATASRIRIRRVLLTDNWWSKDCGPLLAYTRDGNHPIALLPRTAGRYQAFDPVQHIHRRVDEEIALTLLPIAYMFYLPLPERKLTAFDLILFALKNRRKDLLMLLWSGIGITLLGMFLPQATAILIDLVIPDGKRRLLIEIGLGLLAGAVGSLIFQLTRGLAMMRLEILGDAATQSAAWDRLLNLPVPFFRQYSTGDLQLRVSAISAIRHELGGVALQTLFIAIVTLPNLGLLFYYNWELGLIAAAIALIILGVTGFLGIGNLRITKQLQNLEGKILGLMVQLINGVAKLRVAGAEERAFARWSKEYSKQQRLKLKIQQLIDISVVFNQILIPIAQVFLFATAAILIRGGGGLSPGIFLAFNTAFGILIAGITGLGDVSVNFLAAIALWERIKPIMQTEPEVDLNKTDPGQLSGRLTLNRVTFRYRKQGVAVLNNVSLKVEPGEFVALVGPSGSGKSSLFRLLLGFETPQSGEIYYDGQDLRGLNIQAVRRQLGVVIQNSRLNTASIFDNIAGGALITMDDAWEAAHQVGLAEEIAAMPMEMHTVVNEGGNNLSGGQRQRLLIARALVLKPKILLLDESTSALDNKTQAIVTESLDKLKVTRVVIAHRLSTIRQADRIYVLQSGQIVEEGKFTDLIAQNGLFARLMKRQIA